MSYKILSILCLTSMLNACSTNNQGVMQLAMVPQLNITDNPNNNHANIIDEDTKKTDSSQATSTSRQIFKLQTLSNALYKQKPTSNIQTNSSNRTDAILKTNTHLYITW